MGLAVFVDAGNVFAAVSDMRLSSRVSLGTGLRWVSPLGLLRLDVAWPVRPLPDEPHRLMMFSIGQAF